jgi:hypothetical protein
MPTQVGGATVFGANFSRFSGRAQMPPTPQGVRDVQAAARSNHPEHAWTGVNFVKADSSKDVKEFLGESRDAARTMISSNTDMWVVRHSYHTGEPMQAFLNGKPPGDKLQLNVGVMPSWHAQASGDYSVKSELHQAKKNDKGVPQLTPDLVAKAMKSSPNYAQTLETEGSGVDTTAFNMVRTFDRLVHQRGLSGDDAVELMDKLVEQYGKLAMGEKFSKENIYNVRVRLPDGKTITKRFDAAGQETDKRSFRSNTAHHSTTSPNIEIDLSQFKPGDQIVVQAWPDGSAGVAGYREARETVINL